MRSNITVTKARARAAVSLPASSPEATASEVVSRAVTVVGFSHVIYLPCSVFYEWHELLGSGGEIGVCREEEAIGIGVGLVTAGQRPLILIQNSGLGNSLNALASLAIAYRVPLVVGVSLAGDSGDPSVARRPLGSRTVSLIEALGCPYRKVESVATCAEVLAEVAALAEEARMPAFCLFPRRSLLAD